MKDEPCIEIDINKVTTLEEAVAVIKLVFMCVGWDGIKPIKVHTDNVNKIPLLNNLIKD